jgi:Ca-activated chloride channel family protein
MQDLAEKGDGNYAYIDGVSEAKKVFGAQLLGTLFTIAKDVKVQVEFNPGAVKAYRLIGYESRVMRAEDFQDAKKDSGELGAGHTVTALYEIVPAGSADEPPLGKSSDSGQAQYARASFREGELALFKIRYKNPEGEPAEELSFPIVDRGVILARSSNDFRFAAAVAGAGLLLRNSPYKGGASYQAMRGLASGALGQDRYGYRAEFIRLLEKAEALEKASGAR